MTNELVSLIKEYYTFRGYKYPNVWEALGFVTTEMGEVYELLLDRSSGFVRNNPDAKPKFSEDRLAEELGDAIMLLVVAGLVEGVDPLVALEEKIRSKMELLSMKKDIEYKQASFVSSLEVE